MGVERMKTCEMSFLGILALVALLGGCISAEFGSIIWPQSVAPSMSTGYAFPV